VAAGIPIRTVSAASKTAAHSSEVGVIQRVRSHHNNTVSADAQLPGPGRKCPVPKKVATSVAQSGARDASEACPEPAELTVDAALRSVFIGLIRAGGEFMV